MSTNFGANQYKEMAIKTANRGQLLLMLYEATIKHIKKAISCIDKKDIPGRGTAIGKAHDIINELVNTLDFEVGGEIARKLESLYNYMIEQLIKANMEQNKAPLIVIQGILENLLWAWREAVAKVNKQTLENAAAEKAVEAHNANPSEKVSK